MNALHNSNRTIVFLFAKTEDEQRLFLDLMRNFSIYHHVVDMNRVIRERIEVKDNRSGLLNKYISGKLEKVRRPSARKIIWDLFMGSVVPHKDGIVIVLNFPADKRMAQILHEKGNLTYQTPGFFLVYLQSYASSCVDYVQEKVGRHDDSVREIALRCEKFSAYIEPIISGLSTHITLIKAQPDSFLDQGKQCLDDFKIILHRLKLTASSVV